MIQKVSRIWSHNRSGFLWVVIFSVLTLGMEYFGWLNALRGVDVLAHGRMTKATDRIVIIEIKEKDYDNKEIFDSKSPLSPSKLVELIKRVGIAHPAVIGVDLDTTTGSYSLPEGFPQNVVWAQAPKVEESEKTFWQTAWFVVQAIVFSRHESPVLSLRKVLGGCLDQERMGVPLFPSDRDGIVRRYQDRFEVKEQQEECPAWRPDKGKIDSLARAVVRHTPGESVREDEDDVLFNFSGGRDPFRIFSAGEFFAGSVDDELMGRLKDKIVLIGGNFPAARDMHDTPLGPMPGVELVAQAIQSELSGGGVRETPNWRAFLYDLVVGGVVVLLFYARPFRQAFWWSIAAMLGLLVGSRLTFQGGQYFVNFAPIVFGVFLHQVYEAGKEEGKEEGKEGHGRAAPRVRGRHPRRPVR